MEKHEMVRTPEGPAGGMEEGTTGVCDEACAQLAKETEIQCSKNRPKTPFEHIHTPFFEGFAVDCHTFYSALGSGEFWGSVIWKIPVIEEGNDGDCSSRRRVTRRGRRTV